MGKGDYSSSDFVPTGDMNDPANIQKNAYDKLIHDQNRGGDGMGGGFIGGLFSGFGTMTGSAASGVTSAGLGIGVIIVLLVPLIVGKVVGTIFAFFGKLGIVGKVLQTVFFGIISAIVVYIVCGHPALAFLATSLVFPVFILVGLWYWLYHYDEIKGITVSEYANNVTVSIAIASYGFIISMLLCGLFGAIFGKTVENISFCILVLAVFTAAILFYFKETKEERKEAAAVRTNAKLKKTILIIAAGYFVFALGSNMAASMLGLEKKEININLSGRSGAASSTDVTMRTLQNVSLYAEPSENANVIKVIGRGQNVVVMFGMEFKDKFMPVRHGDDIGWVNGDFVD